MTRCIVLITDWFCEFCIFHSGVIEDSVLLGSDATAPDD